MLSYWSGEMQKIQSFKLFNKQAVEDDRPIELLGFTQCGEEVELHVLSRLNQRFETIYANLSDGFTHREQMSLGFNRVEEMPLWGRKIDMDKEAIHVKGAYSNTLGNGQLKPAWILAESLRQGWSGKGFEDCNEEALNLTSYKLDISCSQLDELIKTDVVTLERDTWHKHFLVEKPLKLPVNKAIEEPVTLELGSRYNELSYSIVIHEINLRDVWRDFNEMEKNHRANQTFNDQDFNEFIREQTKFFEELCPKEMRLAVVTYEADPEVSIECHTCNYLNSPVNVKRSGSASAVGIIIGLKGEKGSRGLPLKTCVMYEPLPADTESIDFEVFKASVEMSLKPIIFK